MLTLSSIDECIRDLPSSKTARQRRTHRLTRIDLLRSWGCLTPREYDGLHAQIEIKYQWDKKLLDAKRA